MSLVASHFSQFKISNWHAQLQWLPIVFKIWIWACWSALLFAYIKTSFIWTRIKWASRRENLSSKVCEQQRRRPAPLLLAYWKVSYLEKLWENFSSLASLCSWAGWFESHFVGNPEDRFSRVGAQLWSFMQYRWRTVCSVPLLFPEFTNSNSCYL